MKLLVVTQTVDRNDAVLGFFHEWLAALSAQFESIEAVCLKEGSHALPTNVRVHSLGKEKGGEKLAYAKRFLGHIHKLRESYDVVLVHMNPEYVILGGLWWKIWGKKVCLWYNHPKSGLRLWLAMLLADKVFHTSPYAASAGSKKSVRMPAGIDMNVFTPQEVERKPLSIYLQGRVAPSKRVNTACEALSMLRAKGILATLRIVGPEDEAYVATLKERYKNLFEENAIELLGPKPNYETPALFAMHAVSLNLAASGHYDKTVLESAATATPVIVAGYAFDGIVPKEWAGADTPEKLAGTLERFFALSREEQESLGEQERRAVVEREGLHALMSRLSEEISTLYPTP